MNRGSAAGTRCSLRREALRGVEAACSINPPFGWGAESVRSLEIAAAEGRGLSNSLWRRCRIHPVLAAINRFSACKSAAGSFEYPILTDSLIGRCHLNSKYGVKKVSIEDAVLE